jgi:hypothetical protein
LLEIYDADCGEEVLATKYGTSALKIAIGSFFIDRFMEKGTVSVASCSTIQAMLDVWTQTNSTPHRRLAIIVTRLSGRDYRLQTKRLSQLPKLPEDFIKSMLAILESLDTKGPDCCIQFVDLLSRTDDTDVVSCWKDILYHTLEKESDKLIDHAIDKYNLLEWFEFMMKLNRIFADVIKDPKASPPQILRLRFHSRVQNLFVSGLPAITRLEEAHGFRAKSAIKCIFKAESEATNMKLPQLMRSLTKAQGQPAEKLIQEIVCQLAADGKNASSVSDCATALLATSETGHGVCRQILDSISSDGIPAEVHEVEVAGWLEDEDDDDLHEWDKVAIKALASIYDVRIHEGGIPKVTLMVAMKYYEEQEAKILAEADRLEDIKDALKAQDPHGTRTLLGQIGYPDISKLDEELAHLPPGIVDFVEKQSENEIEVSFPLDAFTELQRAATGIGDAKMLLVRMFIHYDGDMSPAFCMHLDNGDNSMEILETWEHSPWVCFLGTLEPHRSFCNGRQTLLTYHLSRVLHRHMKLLGEIGIAGIHGLMKCWINEYAQVCVVCGVPHRLPNRGVYSAKTTLRKPLPCIVPQCNRLWNTLSLPLRIPEIRTDPFAVDMLLTGVYAAASSGRVELLPGCPIPGHHSIKAILDTLPPLQTLAHSPEISEVLKGCHKDAEKLLIWACTHFRGLISSASGICRIANLPAGTHQFVLANAKPEIEHVSPADPRPVPRHLARPTALYPRPRPEDPLRDESATDWRRARQGDIPGRGPVDVVCVLAVRRVVEEQWPQ